MRYYKKYIYTYLVLKLIQLRIVNTIYIKLRANNYSLGNLFHIFVLIKALNKLQAKCLFKHVIILLI